MNKKIKKVTGKHRKKRAKAKNKLRELKSKAAAKNTNE
jgi:hypothetical protein